MPFLDGKKEREEKKSGSQRYQQLLSDFYGAPTEFSNKARKNMNSKDNSQ